MTVAQYKIKHSSMSVQQIADALGVKRSSVYSWISGVMPILEHQVKLKALLDIDSDWITEQPGYKEGLAYLEAKKAEIMRAIESGTVRELTRRER